MEVNPPELIIYETEQGEAPFSEWLDTLRDRSTRARIRKRLDSRSVMLRARLRQRVASRSEKRLRHRDRD
jgi:putative component of toxin-antitoxin plasmid stabilization module